MRVCHPLLLMLALVSGGAAAQGTAPKVKWPVFPNDVALDTLVHARAKVSAPPAEAFAAVRAVYEQLKIPREVADSARGVISAIRFRAPKALGTERLSVFLRCGAGLTGDYADAWQVTVAIATFVASEDDGRTSIGTGLVAMARDMAGPYKEPLPCASTGELETRIAKMVSERLGVR